MKREYVMTAVVSAVLGAGLMLFAVGGSRPAGIEGWAPVNREVAAAMAGDSGQGELRRLRHKQRQPRLRPRQARATWLRAAVLPCRIRRIA